jgi:hypothetical protein
VSAPLSDEQHVSRLDDIRRSTDKWRFSGRVEMTTAEATALIACALTLCDLQDSPHVVIGLSTREKLAWLKEKVRNG